MYKKDSVKLNICIMCMCKQIAHSAFDAMMVLWLNDTVQHVYTPANTEAKQFSLYLYVMQNEQTQTESGFISIQQDAVDCPDFDSPECCIGCILDDHDPFSGKRRRFTLCYSQQFIVVILKHYSAGHLEMVCFDFRCLYREEALAALVRRCCLESFVFSLDLT